MRDDVDSGDSGVRVSAVARIWEALLVRSALGTRAGGECFGREDRGEECGETRGLTGIDWLCVEEMFLEGNFGSIRG